MKDYYKILGVPKTADDKEIKSAYRSLSMKYHPDRPGGSEKKFKEINEAHDVLMDPIKRMQFNQGQTPTGNSDENGDFYEEPPRTRFRPSNGGGPGFNMPQGFNFSQFSSGNPFGGSFFRGNPTFENLFGENNFNGFPFEESEPKETEEILKLSLEEMYVGGTHKIQYPKPVTVDGETVTTLETIDLVIPPKCYIGKKFRLNIPNGNIKHSVMIVIQPKKHKIFRLAQNSLGTDNADLEITVPLSLKDSLVGFSFKLNGIDGEQIDIQQDRVIDPRKPYRISGKGFVNKNGNRGDLYLKFDIKYPKKLTKTQRSQLNNIL